MGGMQDGMQDQMPEVQPEEMQLQDQEDALYSEQIILDEEIELKKKIALYYHPMVSIIKLYWSKAFSNFHLNLIVSKLSLSVVCPSVTGELSEIEQTIIHGA